MKCHETYSWNWPKTKICSSLLSALGQEARREVSLITLLRSIEAMNVLRITSCNPRAASVSQPCQPAR